MFELLSKLVAAAMRLLLNVHGLVVVDAATASLRSPMAVILGTINYVMA
jgi:hypothetical protein